MRPLEQANDWAYLIDHTVQIGTVTFFAVVGVRLSQLPYPRCCLQREDLVLIALTPATVQCHAVKQALEEAEFRTGVPRLIVSDEAGCAGRHQQYCGDHPHTSSTCDMAHKGANLLRKLLEGNARWPDFVARLGQTKGKLHKQRLACCVGPSLRPKSRFMNLDARCGGRGGACSADQPWPTSAGLRIVNGRCSRKSTASNGGQAGWPWDYREASSNGVSGTK